MREAFSLRIGVRREISGGNGRIGHDVGLRLDPIILFPSDILLTHFSSLLRGICFLAFPLLDFICFYLRDTFGWFYLIF